MRFSARTKRVILGVPGIWIALIPLKLIASVNALLAPRIVTLVRTAFASREVSNHSYHNTETSIYRLAVLLASIDQLPIEQVRRYCQEIQNNLELHDLYRAARAKDKMLANLTDAELRFGRQLLYYCLVRARKPGLVFEAGTAHGIGSLLILHALRKNAAEGSAGRLITVDMNPNAGKLLQHLPPSLAALLDARRGDSETELAGLDAQVDLFFHDTANIAHHENRHYELLQDKLSEAGAICTTWGGAGRLAAFSCRQGRRYFEFTNEARGHWCSDTLGMSLPPSQRDRPRTAESDEDAADWTAHVVAMPEALGDAIEVDYGIDGEPERSGEKILNV